MIAIEKLTPAIGAVVTGVDLDRTVSATQGDAIYQALLEHQVIFIRGTSISPKAHLDFAASFGELDQPHIHYPHVEGFENIVLLENDSNHLPDTNSWHTDLTFKAKQPFASILIARAIPECGGDTLWASNYAAYDRLSSGMKNDLQNMQAVHDLGDFRNSFISEAQGKSGAERLDEALPRFGHQIRPLIGVHPVTGRKFLNFNEAFVSHIVGLTMNESNALKTLLANHMNKPEVQVRWRWQVGDLAMWDNRVTMHYAVADYLPHYRCMNRVTVVEDRRAVSRPA